MVPLSAVISVKTIVGPEMVERFNGFIAAKVLGNAAPGYSSGDAIGRRKVAREVLPPATPRVDRPGLPGKAHRQRLGHRLGLRHHHGLPDPGRAVRSAGRCRWR
jgi:hypothetical protein